MSKPYEFIKFLPNKPYIPSGSFERGIINLKIKVLTPLHISSGLYQEKNGLVYKRFIRVGKDIIIPGTSLKGCIRNIAESISYCCINPLHKLNINKLPKKDKCIQGKRCIICNIFGSMEFRGKVRFSDLRLKQGNTDIINIPRLFAPRPDEDLYMGQDGKYKGYKFYHHGIESICEKGSIPCEFVKVGSIFEGEIIFEDMSSKEVELLCFALGLNGHIQPKIGYGKPAYYGSIEVSSDSKWAERANIYKNTADKHISENITALIGVLNFKNAKKTTDWVSTSPSVRTY